MVMELDIKPRDVKRSPDALREEGVVPGVVYGSKEASTPIEVSASAFRRVWKAAGETTVVLLKGLDSEKQTLIHDVQWHPVSGLPLHVDFYAIEKGQKVHVAVPLHFIGEAPAERIGGVVVKATHELEIEVAPAELPHGIDIDLSTLAEIGDHITAGDIKLPPSATLKIDPSGIIVTISEAKEEPVEAPAPAEGAEAAPEGVAAPAAEAAEGEKAE